MHELEKEAPVCEEDRRRYDLERLTEAVQETEVQRIDGLVIVTEAVQETVQEMAPEGLVEGLLVDDLLVKSLQ
jgi:hypothetical protein